jgi:hypothetical protein
MKRFGGFGSRFTELHTKPDADKLSILSSTADKTKHEVEKHLCKSNACLQHCVTWLEEVWPWPPLSSFPRAVTTITVQELSDRTSYVMFCIASKKRIHVTGVT